MIRQASSGNDEVRGQPLYRPLAKMFFLNFRAFLDIISHFATNERSSKYCQLSDIDSKGVRPDSEAEEQCGVAEGGPRWRHIVHWSRWSICIRSGRRPGPTDGPMDGPKTAMTLTWRHTLRDARRQRFPQLEIPRYRFGTLPQYRCGTLPTENSFAHTCRCSKRSAKNI